MAFSISSAVAPFFSNLCVRTILDKVQQQVRRELTNSICGATSTYRVLWSTLKTFGVPSKSSSMTMPILHESNDGPNHLTVSL
jgi:hypothetical protein